MNGQKWFLLFVFRDLRTVFRIAGFPGFFAVSALLEPAKVLEATERQVHNLDGRVWEGGGNLFSGGE